jgi:hypothetical protein
MTWLIATIGWAGAASVLVAYLLLLRGRISSDGHHYLTLNFLGSACLVVSTYAAHAWPSAAVNVIWLAIGLGPLCRASVKRRAQGIFRDRRGRRALGRERSATSAGLLRNHGNEAQHVR